MPLKVEIPDEEVRSFCNASSRTDPGEALMEWLYGDPRFSTNREIYLGRLLVQQLVRLIRAGETE